MAFYDNWFTKKTDDGVDDNIPKAKNLYGNNNIGMNGNTIEVEITVDKKIRAKYQKGWIKKIRNVPITEVVIHGTAGGMTVAGLLHWMYNEGRKTYNKGIGLFHYAIGRGMKGEKDGLICEVIDPDYWVYSSTSGKHDKTAINIELINTSKSNRDPYTEGQYESLFNLIFNHLMVVYPTINRITGHRYNIWRWNSNTKAKKKDKNCPGNFDWNRLENELNKRQYAFDKDGTQLKYNIRKG